MISRIYVEKKPGFDIEAQKLQEELRQLLKIEPDSLRILNRYDFFIPGHNDPDKFIYGIFAEINQDNVIKDDISYDPEDTVFAVEYQPGQYDARSDAAEQCMRLLEPDAEPEVKHAKVYIIKGSISPEDIKRIQNYMINPLDSQLSPLERTESFRSEKRIPEKNHVLTGFAGLSDDELAGLIDEYSLAMDEADIRMIRDYFRDEEKRDINITELKVLDTYWSDHCRHTTFLTSLTDIKFAEGRLNKRIKEDYELYLEARAELGRQDRPECLMDIATIGAGLNKKRGLLDDLEQSAEVNACSYKTKVRTDRGDRDYLIMFKNETHNHPTEIEPFGGAATCLGGVIRDPLSARAYVYQSMRVSGSADPTVPVENTMKGKLPQRKITTQAAKGFSSYGNQIGLCTGQVREYYHPDFAAKRFEAGAVIAAAPLENVVRGEPMCGDLIFVIGGRTGRDGIGGASGSSKSHNVSSIDTAASEVQKGNAPEERKIQRLFRNAECTKLIKRCNDFGAGGVCVAVGELADSLFIDLDTLLVKYEGLSAPEIATSESQERMAVVIDPKDEEAFVSYVKEENIEYSKTAVVTDSGRIIMHYMGEEVLSLKRSFISTNGAEKQAEVYADFELKGALPEAGGDSFISRLSCLAENLNTCSQQGLAEMFDNTIGASNILLPFGGRYMLTPSDVMASLIPVPEGTSETAGMMSHGYDPLLAEYSPYLGGLYAVVSSVNKLVCAGAGFRKIKLSLQEYFEKLGKDPKKWAKVFSALLGAFKVQHVLGISAIGGKDSMSGTYENLNVPPTLVSFAVTDCDAADVRCNVFPDGRRAAYVLSPKKDEDGIIDLDDYKRLLEAFCACGEEIPAAAAVGFGGIAYTAAKMCLGNKKGFVFSEKLTEQKLFETDYSSLLICTDNEAAVQPLSEWAVYAGEVSDEAFLAYGGQRCDTGEFSAEMRRKLSDVFPLISEDNIYTQKLSSGAQAVRKSTFRSAAPEVFVPVFEGTNCEYDTISAFERAGAKCTSLVFRNLTAEDIKESAKQTAEMIRRCQILALPGGFSAGDEPDGSAKYIVNVLKNEYIAEAVNELLYTRDGLIIGICNGFQALIKTGLLPYGKLGDVTSDSPTLTFNTIGRHVAKLVRTTVSSKLSPWLSETELGEVHTVALSHGEGRFFAQQDHLERMKAAGQICFQYSDADGRVIGNGEVNPNGSVYNIESVCSPDGRILGKMGHSERYRPGVFKNVSGSFDQRIFESGVKYFS